MLVPRSFRVRRAVCASIVSRPRKKAERVTNNCANYVTTIAPPARRVVRELRLPTRASTRDARGRAASSRSSSSYVSRCASLPRALRGYARYFVLRVNATDASSRQFKTGSHSRFPVYCTCAMSLTFPAFFSRFPGYCTCAIGFPHCPVIQ